MSLKWASGPAHPSVFDGLQLSGRFPQEFNELSLANLGQAVAVALNMTVAIMGHDGSEHARLLLHNLGIGLNLQSVDTVLADLCTLDELRFRLIDERLRHGLYIGRDPEQPDVYHLHCLDECGEIIRDEADLRAICTLAQRGAFLPSIRLGRKSGLMGDSLASYCEALLAAAMIGTGDRIGEIVSNAPWPAMNALLTALNAAADNAGIGLRLHVDPLRNSGRRRGGINPREAAQAVKDAVVARGAVMGLIWHAHDRAPDIVDEQGNLLAHRDAMLMIAQALMNDRYGCNIVHDARCTWAVNGLGRFPQSNAFPMAPNHAVLSRNMPVKRATYGFLLPDSHIFSQLHCTENALAAALLLAARAAQGPLSRRADGLCREIGFGSVGRYRMADPKQIIPHVARTLGAADHVIWNGNVCSILGADWRLVAAIEPDRVAVSLSVETRGGDTQALIERIRAALLPHLPDPTQAPA